VEPSSVNRRLTCILAADAVGYSRQMGQDEEGTIRVLAAHRAVIDGIIAFHRGRIVSTAGDSVLAEFASAVEAVRCAVEVQDALRTRNDSLPEPRRMHFRVGVNLGDVVVKDQDLLGDGVNVAARLETIAEPGGICISSSVYDQITGKLDLGFHDIGEQSLKNIARPIRVYRVSGSSGPLRLPPATPPRELPEMRRSPAWAVRVALAALVAAALSWIGGTMLYRRTPGVDVAATAPATAPAAGVGAAPAAGNDADAARAQGEAQRLRAEAESLKRQAEAELARVRAETEASRAAKGKAEAEAAATRLRAAAEADAARIRADAEASAARARGDMQSVARAAKPQETSRPGVGHTADPGTHAPVMVAANESLPAAPGAAGRFDGSWNVTVECGKAADGALGYTVSLVAVVKDGFLLGEQGTEGSSGWLRLSGRIQPDGTAMLDASGITGDPKYNVKAVQRGTPYAYQVAAKFDGARGSGRRLQVRECALTFARQ